MAAYHHIKPGARYPAVMMVHGVNDRRVLVWQGTKYTNRLATASPGGPVLMRLDHSWDTSAGQAMARRPAALEQLSEQVWVGSRAAADIEPPHLVDA